MKKENLDYLRKTEYQKNRDKALIESANKLPPCPHQFFKIADETRKEGTPVEYPVRWGVKVMCALCGEIRILWTEGKVEIL